MKFILTTIAITFTTLTFSQNLNWLSKNETNKSLAYLNFGYDFGITTQVGYGHKLDVFRPILLTADYSFPMGKNLMDDFKVRLGGQILIIEKGNFGLSAKVYGIFRRHETSFVRMASFGSEMAVIAGYYKPTWHIAGEFGFDKSINTHLKHSELMRENFPSIKDGWYIPSGGHYFYGIQGSKTIGEHYEISLRVGGTNAQGKDENTLLPYYAQLGFVYKFPSKKKVE